MQTGEGTSSVLVETKPPAYYGGHGNGMQGVKLESEVVPELVVVVAGMRLGAGGGVARKKAFGFGQESAAV